MLSHFGVTSTNPKIDPKSGSKGVNPLEHPVKNIQLTMKTAGNVIVLRVRILASPSEDKFWKYKLHYIRYDTIM